MAASPRSRESSDLRAKPDLQELWVAVRSGRAEEEEPLLKEVYRKAYPVALRKLRNEQDAAVAAQQCTFSFWVILHTLDQSTNVLLYVYRMAGNAARDIMRARGRRREEPLPEPQEHGRELASDPPNPEEKIDRKRLIERLKRCLGEIKNEKYRKAIQFMGIEGMSLEEMADRMGYPVATAKNFYYRGGMRALRECLKERETSDARDVNKDGRI